MCCLFGLIDYGHRLTGRQKGQLIRALAVESEARGTDAAGLAYNSGGRLQIHKRPGPAHKLRLFIPDDAHVIMGHSRMTTQGRAKFNRNNHPFAGNVPNTRFALAHNGVLYNDHILRREKELPKGDSLWDEVTMNAKFPGRILVTTAVVDNGVNLKDNQLVHIVLQSTDHVQFIQELGRKRMGTSEVVHLYIPDLTARQLSLLETRNNGLLKHLSDFKEDSPQYLYYKRMDLWNNGTPELRHLFVLDNNGSLTANRCAEQVLLQRKLFYQELKTAFRVGDRHPFIRHVVCSWLGFSEEALDDCRWHGSVMQDELDLFLKSWIGKPIVGKGEQNNFSEKYRRLRTAAYGSRKKGNNGADRIWGARIIKGDLADLKLPYDLDIDGSIWVIQKVERQDSAGDD